eukprot:jgi/Bigna1/145954/aug1.106_g20662
MRRRRQRCPSSESSSVEDATPRRKDACSKRARGNDTNNNGSSTLSVFEERASENSEGGFLFSFDIGEEEEDKEEKRVEERSDDRKCSGGGNPSNSSFVLDDEALKAMDTCTLYRCAVVTESFPGLVKQGEVLEIDWLCSNRYTLVVRRHRCRNLTDHSVTNNSSRGENAIKAPTCSPPFRVPSSLVRLLKPSYCSHGGNSSQFYAYDIVFDRRKGSPPSITVPATMETKGWSVEHKGGGHHTTKEAVMNTPLPNATTRMDPLVLEPGNNIKILQKKWVRRLCEELHFNFGMKLDPAAAAAIDEDDDEDNNFFGGDLEIFAVRGMHSTPWHFDGQHNFTIQLKGQKLWTVESSGIHNPLSNLHPKSVNIKAHHTNLAVAKKR